MAVLAALTTACASLAQTLPVPTAEEMAVAQDSLAANPGGAPADTAASVVASADVAIEQARELLRDGEYDRSIEVLKAALETARDDPERLRAVYLLLIKTYVFIGNDLKFRPQGREASNLNYQEARRLIAECLGTRALRHTHPEPMSEYPPEMIVFFDEARRQIFGAYRVREVVPPDAVVLLDGDTLRALPGEKRVGDVNIAAGPHVVVVRARGFKEITDRITISPDVTLERSYRMTRRRGSLWYATRAVGALGLVGGVAAIAARGGDTPAPSPLPEAPGPP